VHVLDDHHVQRARRGKLVQQGAEQLVPPGPGLAQAAEFAAELAGQVEQRPERAGREQAVARSPRPQGVRKSLPELVDQRRLADPGLAGDKHQPTGSVAGLACVFSQGCLRRLPFQQHAFHCHAHSGHRCAKRAAGCYR
jgi:hypothetical protein